jgi:hypothetical protein
MRWHATKGVQATASDTASCHHHYPAPHITPPPTHMQQLADMSAALHQYVNRRHSCSTAQEGVEGKWSPVPSSRVPLHGRAASQADAAGLWLVEVVVGGGGAAVAWAWRTCNTAASGWMA